MRVLITGHLGYIGPVMVRVFKKAGHFVAGLDTGYFRECMTSDTEVAPDAETIKDIRLVEAADFAGIHCVVHLAALSNDPMGALAPALTLQINHEGSVRAARLAKAAGAHRFIFASSCSLYGAADSDKLLTEEAKFNPVSAYAVSKVRTETDLRDLADDNFSPVFLRNATAYGVSPHMRFDLVLNNLMAWAKTSQHIRVMSDGTPWRPLVHIEDISRAALCAAEAPQEMIHNQAFNIGRTDANYRIRDIAEAVARHVPNSTLEITGETSGDTRSYKVSFEKAANHLAGFSPTWTIERGRQELDRWFESRTETMNSVQSRRYVRLAQLTALVAESRLDQELFWTTARSSS